MDYARRVALAMMDPRVMNGIAQAVASIAKQHIAQGFGRGGDGGAATFEPLKDLTTEYWTTRKPKEGILGTREVTQMRQRKSKDGRITVKPTKVTEYLVKGSSYRAGGQPLRDTGNLLRSLGARVRRIGPNRMEVILTGPQYAIFQEMGFTTDGPNYIPLTRKGVRQHSTGNNPRNEGLLAGKDYMMAWGGVTVPARPFLVPTAKEWGDVGRTIRLGLAKVLKGKR